MCEGESGARVVVEMATVEDTARLLASFLGEAGGGFLLLRFFMRDFFCRFPIMLAPVGAPGFPNSGGGSGACSGAENTGYS